MLFINIFFFMATGTLTLVEAAKINYQNGNTLLAAYQKQYADYSPILQNIPFRRIEGNAIKIIREKTLPSVGWRKVNEEFATGTGETEEVFESLSIAGGLINVDEFIVETLGENQRTVQEAMKIKALSLRWTADFINGDQQTDPEEITGLKTRLTGTQLVSAGSTSGGDALSLYKLDELIDSVEDPTHLITNKAIARRLAAAARNSSVGGEISFMMNEFGKRITMYNGLPMLILDEDNIKAKILPFTESGAGGGTAQCTSIYCVSFGEMMLEGLENPSMEVQDFGLLPGTSSYCTKVKWNNTISITNPRSAARLYGVKDAAVTA